MFTQRLHCVFALVLLFSFSAEALEINTQRAKFHYQLHCQGCHTENGRGFGEVPQLKGYIGNFLKIEEGRSYLVQVPGSANAYLESDHLAELLNWMLLEFSEGSLPSEWQAYDTTEIEALRKTPLLEVENYRKTLVKKLAAKIENQAEKTKMLNTLNSAF